MKLPESLIQTARGLPEANPPESSKPRACSKVSKRTGRPCKVPPMRGSDPPVCDIHAGQSRATYKRQATEQKAVAVVREYSADIATDNPLQALADISAEVTAVKDLWGAKARQLAEYSAERYISDTGVEQIRGEVQIYERALDRCVSTLATIAKLDIDERLARVSEAQVELVDRALTAALVSAGLTNEMQRQVRTAFGRSLRVQSQRADHPKMRKIGV